MKTTLNRRELLALTAAAAVPAWAQTGSDKPLRIVVPYPAGGTSDFQARAISAQMSQSLGQPVIVDNKPGASGMIGTQAVAAAAPDGNTVALVNNGFLLTPLIHAKPTFQTKDFTPVGILSVQPMVMVTNREMPAANVREFIEWARARPGAVEYASAGAASYGHLATALFAQTTGLKMVHVPYQGEAPMTMALRSNQVKLMMTAPSPSIMGAVKEGSLKLLGVASSKPVSWLPGVPVVGDSVPGFVTEVWYGFVAPAATPPAAVARINAAMNKALAAQDIRDKFAASGAQAVNVTPAEFAAALKQENARWEQSVPKLGIRIEA